MTRRGLLAGGIAALMLGGSGSAAYAAGPQLRRGLVQRVIQFHVPGIVFDGDDLAVFADYINATVLSRQAGGARRLLRYAALSLLYHSPATRGRLGGALPTAEIDREIVSAFFLCTDFWQEPHRHGRRVALVRPPDPYEARCANPMAVLAGLPRACIG